MITRQKFRVSDLAGLDDFYCRILGMGQTVSQNTICFGYNGDDCLLGFCLADVTSYVSSRQDFYWKIGVTVPNLDTACNWLQKNGVTVSAPRQFRDIGYLAHITDPNGFSIELWQHGFEGNEKPALPGHPIEAGATVAHITLRVTEIETAHGYFTTALGMRLMSIQPVTDFGFTLYFYAWSDEELPSNDLRSVKNREWLWERAYTLIELQHLEAPATSIIKPDSTMAGFAGFSYRKLEEDCEKHIFPMELAEMF